MRFIILEWQYIKPFIELPRIFVAVLRSVFLLVGSIKSKRSFLIFCLLLLALDIASMIWNFELVYQHTLGCATNEYMECSSNVNFFIEIAMFSKFDAD